MSAYSLQASNQSQHTPALKKGIVKIYASVNIYWIVGENPTASAATCALLRAGETIELRLPVKCSKIAVLAVNEPGAVTVMEQVGGTKASCAQ